MRANPSDRKRPFVVLAVLAVLILGGGALVLLMQGGTEEAAPPAGTAAAPPAAQPELPVFNAPAPQGAETHPLEPAPDTLPGSQAPIAAAIGDPVGGLAGQVVDKNHQPVEGVKLSVYRGNALLGNVAFPGSRRVLESTATSGADGRFELKRIPVGQPYVIVGEHDDFARSEIGGLRVTKDAVAPDVILIMSEGAVVQGIVTGKGRSGPIPNARVELYYQLDNAWLKPEDQKPYKVAFTEAGGKFAFTHVSSSSIRVRVQADGFESQSRTISSALDSEPHDQMISFELGQGNTLPGQTVTDHGVPVPNVRLEANSLTKDVQGTSVAMSDARGNFLLDGLSDATYQVRATCDGYTDTVIQHTDITVGHLQIEMHKRGGVTGHVKSLGGDAIRDFTLLLMKSAPGRDPNYLGDNRHFNAADGAFTFDNIDPGDYVFEARSDDWADSHSDPFTVTGGDDPPTQVLVRMSKGGTVAGTVSTSDKQPAAGALVELHENNFVDSPINQIFKSLGPDDTRERKTRTGPDGRYAFTRIPAGVYQLSAALEGAAPTALNDVNVADDGAGGNAAINLVLPPGAVISGRAISAAQRPLAYCKVQISQQESGYMQMDTTDAAGSFSFRNLRSGKYSITVTPTRDDEDKPLHPFMQLVNASKSKQEVFVAEGQVVDGVLIQLPATSGSH